MSSVRWMFVQVENKIFVTSNRAGLSSVVLTIVDIIWRVQIRAEATLTVRRLEINMSFNSYDNMFPSYKSML